eukprot:12085492-Alexandrium_andersonii.AAC.1
MRRLLCALGSVACRPRAARGPFHRGAAHLAHPAVGGLPLRAGPSPQLLPVSQPVPPSRCTSGTA